MIAGNSQRGPMVRPEGSARDNPPTATTAIAAGQRGSGVNVSLGTPGLFHVSVTSASVAAAQAYAFTWTFTCCEWIPFAITTNS
jgi:hypothetical protein